MTKVREWSAHTRHMCLILEAIIKPFRAEANWPYGMFIIILKLCDVQRIPRQRHKYSLNEKNILKTFSGFARYDID